MLSSYMRVKTVNSFVAVNYTKIVPDCIAVSDFDKEFQDYLIQFPHLPGLGKAYWFPDDELEQCFKSHEQILGVLPQPRLTGGSKICYVFSSQHLKALM